MKYLLPFIWMMWMKHASGQTPYERDFDIFCNIVYSRYAYLNEQSINMERVKTIYQPLVKNITNKAEFIRFMEQLIHEFHNGHISLNTNLESSNRIIPSGQDMYIQQTGEKFFITDLRPGFGAALSGLKTGDEVVRFNQQSIPEQMKAFLPKYTATHSNNMVAYALNMLFAGTHNTQRTITVKRDGKYLDFFPDKWVMTPAKMLVETRVLQGTTGYIKINNALGNMETIAAFDQALDSLMEYKNLVIDLTETAGGGNTTVARCILGRFITETMAYQQHAFDEPAFQTQRKWVEYVVPRKTAYKGKVYVLVGHWTGSMGEGIAIGFDGLQRAQIIGTEMARLIGAIEGFVLPETKIGFQIPTERLYHINGIPRELYRPAILTQNTAATYQYMHGIQ